MTVKLELANGETECYETNTYKISKVKDFHPMICKVELFDFGRKIFTKKRHFSFIYKHFVFKSAKVQKQLEELAKLEMEGKNEKEK